MRRSRVQASPECELLALIASIYFEALARTGDHRQAFVDTVRAALLEGYQPYAAWVTDAMLAANRPTYAVVLSHPESLQIYPVTVGGVSIDWAAALMDSEQYTPETRRGWRLIEGEAVDLYMRWARQEQEPPQLKLDFAMGIEP